MRITDLHHITEPKWKADVYNELCVHDIQVAVCGCQWDDNTGGAY